MAADVVLVCLSGSSERMRAAGLLRSAGLRVRVASRPAELAKALADSQVRVVVTQNGLMPRTLAVALEGAVLQNRNLRRVNLVTTAEGNHGKVTAISDGPDERLVRQVAEALSRALE